MKPEDARSECSDGPVPDDTAAHPARAGLWEHLLARENLSLALRRVEQNAGAAGIDAMTTVELRPWLKEHWPGVRAALDAALPTAAGAPGDDPQAGGRAADAGGATVLDRLIQQAMLQVLDPVFEPHFSDHSYGFRPGRSAHQAVVRARQFIQDDAAWVVDVDLEAFFDRVQHDALMARVARRVDDKRVLGLLRLFCWPGCSATRAWRRQEFRKGRRSRRCWPTSCSTISTQS